MNDEVNDYEFHIDINGEGDLQYFGLLQLRDASECELRALEKRARTMREFWSKIPGGEIETKNYSELLRHLAHRLFEYVILNSLS